MIQESIFFFSASNIPTKQSQYRSRSRLLDHQEQSKEQTVQSESQYRSRSRLLDHQDRLLLSRMAKSQYRSRSRLLDQFYYSYIPEFYASLNTALAVDYLIVRYNKMIVELLCLNTALAVDYLIMPSQAGVRQLLKASQYRSRSRLLDLIQRLKRVKVKSVSIPLSQ